MHTSEYTEERKSNKHKPRVHSWYVADRAHACTLRAYDMSVLPRDAAGWAAEGRGLQGLFSRCTESYARAIQSWTHEIFPDEEQMQARHVNNIHVENYPNCRFYKHMNTEPVGGSLHAEKTYHADSLPEQDGPLLKLAIPASVDSRENYICPTKDSPHSRLFREGDKNTRKPSATTRPRASVQHTRFLRPYLQKVPPWLDRPHPTRQHDDSLPPSSHKGREHPWRGTLAMLCSPHPVYGRCGLRLFIATTAISIANLLLPLSLLLLLLLLLIVLPLPVPLAILFFSTALFCRPDRLAKTSSSDSTAAGVTICARFFR